jgi:hypothetical protein
LRKLGGEDVTGLVPPSGAAEAVKQARIAIRHSSSQPLIIRSVISAGSSRALIGAPSASASQICDHSTAAP